MLRLQIGGMANAFNMGRMLSRYAGDIRSVKPALEKAVEEVIRPSIWLSFENQEETGGSGWEDMEQQTPFWPYRNPKHPWYSGGKQYGPLLDVTGKLRRVTQQKNIWTFDGQAGTAIVHDLPGAEYGRWQDIGFYNFLANRDVPARPFMTIGEQEIKDIEMIFMDYINMRFANVVGKVNTVVDWG